MSEQLDRQIENLETRLEELTTRRGAVDVQHAKTGQGQGREQQGTRLAGATAAAPAVCEEIVLEPDPVCPKCGTEMPMLGED
ncbi:MAG: IS66 family transposase, partial [Burkholderia sp.]